MELKGVREQAREGNWENSSVVVNACAKPYAQPPELPSTTHKSKNPDKKQR